VRIDRVSTRAGTSGCSEDFSLVEKREEVPVKYEAWRWIMDDELIFDRAMSPEIPESYAGQRRAEADE
jgi:hypothetical protein